MMDSAALDPRLRNPHDSSSISVSVAPAASSSSSSSSPSPSISTLTSASKPVSTPDPNPRANGPDPGTSNPNANGSGPGGAPYNNAAAASSTSAHAPSSASSPELQRISQGVQFHTAYSLAPANTHAHPFPASSATAGFPDDHTGDHENSGADPKKARACEACRGLKVRCEPVADDPDGACKRCAKAGRNCVITQPTRKRQKKTDSRVAELEKKIDALTATLSATKAGQAAHSAFGQPEAAGGYYRGAPGTDPSRSWSEVDTGLSSRQANMPRSQDPSSYTRGTTMPSALPMAGQKRKHTELSEVDSGARSHISPDIVDRGIVTIGEAAQLLNRYNHQLAPHLPGVVFPPSMTASELRRTKPVLFLAVIAAASSETGAIQRAAVKELMQTFADRIIIVGEKSIELIQALTLAVMWYGLPEHFEDMKFCQLTHMAMTMAIDLGLGKRKPRGGKPPLWGAQPSRRHPQPDPTTVEARRTWLLCYYLTVNVAMSLHRPFLLRWTSFMAECMDVLESSPEAAPTDRYFCHLVWTHQLAEEIGFQFCMDDPSVLVNLSDHMTQHRIRSFERELENHKTQIPAELMQPSLKLGLHTLSLYVHELALQTEPADAFKTPFATEGFVSNPALTPAYTSALAACLTAIDGIFDTFLGIDPTTWCCMPVFNLVRVFYATVILIKIYTAASDPSSDLGKVIDKDSLKVGQRLSNLVEKFRVVADKYRPAANFLTVSFVIRSWFLKFSHGEQKGDATKIDTATDPAGSSQASNSSQASSNPLQLLSEAATKNQAAASNSKTQDAANVGITRSSNGEPDASTACTNSSQHAADSSQERDGRGDSSMPPPPHPQIQAHPHQHGFIGGTPAPWLNFGGDFGYSSLDDGFAQAWDLAMEGLGDGPGGLQDLNDFALLAPEPVLGPATGGVPGSDVYQS